MTTPLDLVANALPAAGTGLTRLLGPGDVGVRASASIGALLPGLVAGLVIGLVAGLALGSVLAWRVSDRRWRALADTLALGRALIDAGRAPDRSPDMLTARRPPFTRRDGGLVSPATASHRVSVTATVALRPAASMTPGADRVNVRGSGPSDPTSTSDTSHDVAP